MKKEKKKMKNLSILMAIMTLKGSLSDRVLIKTMKKGKMRMTFLRSKMS